MQEVEEPAVAGRDNGKENFYDVAASEKMTEERKEQEQKMANKPEIGEERSGSNREEKIRYMAESVPDFGTEGREFEEDPVELWIGNRQSYLEGSLKGEWVSLPMDDKRLQEVMERIAHIHKDTRGGLAIMDKHCREDCSYLGKAVDEYTSIMDVNTVAGLIGYQSHPAVELYVSDRIPDISELANLLMQERDISYNPYSFRGMENLPDISAEEKLGYTVVENDNEFYDMLTDRGLADYIDYEAVGRDASLNGVLLGEEGYLDMKLSSVDIERYSLNEIRQSQEAYGVYDTVKEEYCRIGSDIMTFQSYEDASSAAKAMNEEISPKRSTGGLSRTLCALIERSGREGTYTIPAGELPRATLKLLEAECGREGLGIFISFGGPGADVTVREGLSGQYDMAAEGETRNSDKGKEIRPQQKWRQYTDFRAYRVPVHHFYERGCFMALGKEKKLSEISHSIEQIKADHEYFRMILESIGFGYEELLREPWESAVVAIREYEISIGRELSDSVLKHYRKEQLIQYADLCRQYMAFGRETEQCMAGELNPRNAVWVCNTPPVFASAGCRSLPMLFTQSHIRNCMKDRIRTNSHYHGLTMEKMKRLPEALADPAVIMRSSTREDALLVVLGYRDGYAQPVVAAVIPEGKGVY